MNAETKRCFAALLHKQRREQSAFLNRSARTGKQRTQTGKLAFGALYGAIALVLMASFASLSWPLAQLLLPAGWETLYFLVLELLALLVSWPGRFPAITAFFRPRTTTFCWLCPSRRG